MKVALDTNVLVRAAVQDDAAQAAVVDRLLAESEVFAVAISSLCEFVWVLRKVYGLPSSDAAMALRALIAVDKVQVDRAAVEAGLAVLDAGGDFADGVIAYEGRWLGGEMFMSFDRQAVALLVAQGHAAQVPS